MNDRKQEAIEIIAEERGFLRESESDSNVWSNIGWAQHLYNRLLPLMRGEFPEGKFAAQLHGFYCLCQVMDLSDAVDKTIPGFKELLQGETPAEGDNILEQDTCETCRGSGVVDGDFHDDDGDPIQGADNCPTCKGTGKEKEDIIADPGEYRLTYWRHDEDDGSRHFEEATIYANGNEDAIKQARAIYERHGDGTLLDDITLVVVKPVWYKVRFLEQDDPDMKAEYDFSKGVRGAVKPKICQTCGGTKKVCVGRCPEIFGSRLCEECGKAEVVVCPDCLEREQQDAMNKAQSRGLAKIEAMQPRDPREGRVEQRSGERREGEGRRRHDGLPQGQEARRIRIRRKADRG